MKELQEEYLFLKREGINGWEDVFRVKQSAEKKIEDIDAKKKELYNEHARYKYQYEKDGDVTAYLYHEAHYREQLAELKERRKEAKRECATINRCISESTFAHMEIPLDVNVENLYMVDMPELERSEISYEESEVYDEVAEYRTAETDDYTELYDEAEISEVAEPSCEPINEFYETEDGAYKDLQNVSIQDMTKECYEALTDKEKVEWLGIAGCSVQDAIQRFISKLDSIGVVYRYSADMLDEFMRLESVVAQMKRGEREADKDREIESKSRSL